MSVHVCLSVCVSVCTTYLSLDLFGPVCILESVVGVLVAQSRGTEGGRGQQRTSGFVLHSLLVLSWQSPGRLT